MGYYAKYLGDYAEHSGYYVEIPQLRKVDSSSSSAAATISQFSQPQKKHRKRTKMPFLTIDNGHVVSKKY